MCSQGDLLRDQGIDQAVMNADAYGSDWSINAVNFLKRYPKKEFLAEDVRAWAYSKGLAIPPSGRAWGGVIRKAKEDGLIKFVRFQNVKNPRAHSTPASVWRKAK